MANQPLSSDEIRAAAHVHHELGPEFSDAVVESFLEKIDREITTRIDARISAIPKRRAGQLDAVAKRRALMAGTAFGAVVAGTPLTAFAFIMASQLSRGGQLLGILLAIAVVFGVSAIGLQVRTRR